MMIRDLLHPILTVILSYSLALGPVALLLPTPAAAQQPAAEQNLGTRLVNLESDLDLLLDRAQFPNVPRMGVRGLPSSQELRDAEGRIAVLTKEFRDQFVSRVQEIQDANLEWLPLQDLSQYYSLAQKIESLKVILGLKSEPADYERLYGMSFSLQDLSQLNFFTKLAFTGRHNVEIGDLLATQKFPMLTDLVSDGRRMGVTVRLNPDFLKTAEYQRMAVQMNMRSSLMFAAHYAADGMYRAQAMTAYLGPAEKVELPEPSEYWRSRFASFKVAREEILRSRENAVFARQKPLLVRAIIDSLIELQKAGAGQSLNESFWASYQTLRGSPPPQLNLEAIKIEEMQAFFLAITATVRLWNLRNLNADLVGAIQFAKRLSLRFLVLNNSNLVAELNPEQLRSLEAVVEARAVEFTQQLSQSPTLRQRLTRIQAITPETLRLDTKARFFIQLTKMAERIRHFESKEVNLQYLFESKRSAIQALAPSPLVGQTINALEQIGQYQQGYALYRQSLLTLLQAYRYPSAEKLTLKHLNDNLSKIQFNPHALADSVPADYIRALEQDPQGRKKDISDMLALGRILKFDIYETLPRRELPDAFGSPPGPALATLENLKIHDGHFFAGERAAYLQALKTDVFNALPVLKNHDLYKALVSENHSFRERRRVSAGSLDQREWITSVMVADSHRQAVDNLASLEAQTRKIEQGAENSLANVGYEMRVLVSRTSQMNLVLGSISGFASYFEEIRRELLLPGFWGDQWNKFNSWTSMANLALILFFVANAATRFSGVAGRISDVFIYLLSPIFGPNLKYLSTVIWSLIGLNVADAAVRSGLEQWRLGTLRDYFQCNAAAPCVALYADVSRQEDIRNAALMELGTLLIMPVILVGGFMIAAGLGARIANGISNRLLRQVEVDMQTLNLQPGSALGQVALSNARRATHQSLSSTANPVARELSAIYVEQAYSRLQSLILKESRKFAKFDRRLKVHSDRIGLNLGEVKNFDTLAARYGQIESAYRAGQMTKAEYVDKMNSVFAIFTAYGPIWSRMSTNPSLASFYEAIWNANIPAGQAQVMIRTLNQNVIKDFTARMNEFYGTDSRKVDGLVKKLLDEIDKSPEISAERIQQLRRLVQRSRP